MGGVTRRQGLALALGPVAAMEPAADGRGDGSRKTSLLTRQYTRLRERLLGGVLMISTVVLSRCEFVALTWVRALPGAGGSAGALAKSDNDGGRVRQRFAAAEEQEPRRVPGAPETDYHHTVLGRLHAVLDVAAHQDCLMVG